ncbi:MAG: glycosyltransferase [Dysgonamonadaceae bacterium]|jgi:glycosyltransferase involved in cell wall biosynthesis|nr:glycosyltransferase [Dysgonamonadaceae bacterium]
MLKENIEFIKENTKQTVDLVTFAIPVYNAENYIEKTMLSALNQTYPHIEFLIVDDRGTDSTMKIIENIVATHPRGKHIRIVKHPSNIGIGAGRNTAIEQANGKYLFFMDNDDTVTPDCIQKLYDKMLKTDVDFVCGSHNEVEKGKIRIRSNNFIEKDKKQIILSYFDSRKFPSIATWNKLFKVSFLRENNIRCVPHQITEDWYFTFQLLLHAQSYCVIPDITYSYLYCHSLENKSKEWFHVLYRQLVEISGDSVEYLRKSPLEASLKRKIKIKLFTLRLYMSRAVLKPGYQEYITDFLNPAFLKDKDIFRSITLMCAYIFSNMPLFVKKAGLHIVSIIKNL